MNKLPQKPLSTHWADIAAFRVIQEHGDKEEYVVASGITPSGTVHVGNFREVITVDLVARSLMKLGKKVRFIYSWDNFDTFRKVPKNVPNPKTFEQYLRQPIARIPDPWGAEATYAQGRIALFEKELSNVGIYPAYLYQEKKYSSGSYAADIRHALEHKDAIRAILDKHRTEPLPENWLPTVIYCRHCSKDIIASESYLGGWEYSYHCENCDAREVIDIRESQHLKLVWRVDWPMRWHYEKVDFEPGGKDHSSDGGSYDTAKDIIRDVWKQNPPTYLQYDFVMIKGGAGKMSSSSGELYTLSQVLAVYEPQIVRWIFANQRPNHDFAIAFDEDVIKIYEEFDKAERLALMPPETPDSRWELARRAYELALLDGQVPLTLPHRPKFRALCNHLQICSGDIERTFQKYYQNEQDVDKNQFLARAERAWFWLVHYAPEDFRYNLKGRSEALKLSAEEGKVIDALRNIVESVDLETIDEKELQQAIWQKIIKDMNIEAKQAFQIIYQVLIGRDQGPRLPNFLKEIGKDQLLELL